MEIRLADRAGWVLAGGRSRRMGTDKALLDVGNQPLAKRVAAELGRVCGTVALIGDPERYAGLGLRVVPDRFPGLGPLAGMEAALAATTADWNLVTACDMPALDGGILDRLFAAAAEDGAACAMPRYSDGQVEPLCAVFHARCHAAILAALEEGTRKVTEALAGFEPRFGLTLRYVAVSSDASFANLNTPEDVRNYESERNG